MSGNNYITKLENRCLRTLDYIISMLFTNIIKIRICKKIIKILGRIWQCILDICGKITWYFTNMGKKLWKIFESTNGHIIWIILTNQELQTICEVMDVITKLRSENRNNWDILTEWTQTYLLKDFYNIIIRLWKAWRKT